MPPATQHTLHRQPRGTYWRLQTGLQATRQHAVRHLLLSLTNTNASVQSAAWASPTVLDGRLSTRCRCRLPSTTVIWRREMLSVMDPHVPRRSCVWCCWTTSVERFADQSPSASPLPWTVPTGAKKAFIWLCLQGLVTIWFLGADYK